MNRFCSMALLGAISMFFACGDDGGDNGGPGADAAAADAAPVADSAPVADAESEADAAPQLMELDAFCAEDGPLITALRRVFSCIPFFNTFEAYDQDSFAPERLVPLCRARFEGFFADGSISLDEGAIAACLDFIEGSPCELISSGAGLDPFRGTPCELLIQGSYDQDTTCDISAQCAGDAYCQEPQNFGVVAACGTCKPRLDDGAACATDAECSSSSCNSAGVCAAPRQVGEACADNQDCQGLLVCDPDTSLCALSLPRAGDACAAQADCSFPDTKLYCDLASSTCMPLPGPGEACLQNIGGYERLCNYFEYAWCDPVDDVCKAPAISTEGGPCNAFVSLGSGARRCPDGMACTEPFELADDGSAMGICFVPRAQGESCDLAGDGTDACQLTLNCSSNVCELQAGEYTGQCMGEPLPN